MLCDNLSEVKGMKVAVTKPGKSIQEICLFHQGYLLGVGGDRTAEMGVLGVQGRGKVRLCLFYQLHLWYVSLVAWPSVLGEGCSRPSDRINRRRSGREKLLTLESKS